MSRSKSIRTALVGIGASLGLLAALLASAAAVGADEPPVRIRFGTGGEDHHDVPEDGGTITTTTPTLIYDGTAPDAEIVVAATVGGTVSSGLLDDQEWIVDEGALTSGGSYEWYVAAPTGTTTSGISLPTLVYRENQPLTVDGAMMLGARIVDHAPIQEIQTFDIATGVGVSNPAAGLRADFFPHYDIAAQVELDEDGNPVDELPGTVVPNPGSELVSNTASWHVFDQNMEVCKYKEGLGAGEENWTVWEWVLCSLSYSLDASAEVSADSGHAAAYNIVGRNVAPSFSTTLTEAVAVDDGFVLSTAGDDRISADFPLQTEFGYRALGYIEVPETGTYTFGTQSPGGASLHIYDTNDTDLAKIEVSHPDAWMPTTLGEGYSLTTHYAFDNKKTGETTYTRWWGLEKHHHYEYGPEDTSWIDPDPAAIRALSDELRESGPRGDHIRWGQEIELEANRAYPIAFTGWVGPLNGTIGIHVAGDDIGEIPLPFEWLTAAPYGTVDFDRGFANQATSDIDGTAFAISGHGDALAVLGSDRSLRFYDTDGGIGWRLVDSIEGLGFEPPLETNWASGGLAVAFDDPGTTLVVAPDRWPTPHDDRYETELLTHRVATTNQDLTGNIYNRTGSPLLLLEDGRYTLQETFSVDVNQSVTGPTVPVHASVTQLSFRLDHDDQIVGATAGGTVRFPGTHWSISDAHGHLDPDTGRLHLDLISRQGNQTRVWGMVLDQTGVEPGPPSTLPNPLEVVLVDKIDPEASWTADNITVEHLSSLLDEAGLEQPAISPDVGVVQRIYRVASTGQALGGHITGRNGSPSFAFEDGAYALVDQFGLNVNVNVSGPSQPAVVTVTDLTFRLDHDNQIVDAGAGGTVRFPGSQWSISDARGHLDPDTGRLYLDLISRQGNQTRVWAMVLNETDVVGEWPTRIHQEVEITPDGNTVAVLQPVDEDFRVVVVDRAEDGYPWTIVGTFDVHPGAEVMALGRDGDTRMLALVDAEGVTVHEWTPGAGDWSAAASIPVEGAVSALAFDYWAEHLAIGQPDLGRISIQHRDYGSSSWSHQVELDGAPGFGGQLDYTWGLLTVGNREQSLVRLYRDTGVQQWSTYSDWVERHLDGPGTEVLASTGGEPRFARTIATSTGLGDTYDAFTTHVA